MIIVLRTAFGTPSALRARPSINRGTVSWMPSKHIVLYRTHVNIAVYPKVSVILNAVKDLVLGLLHIRCEILPTLRFVRTFRSLKAMTTDERSESRGKLA